MADPHRYPATAEGAAKGIRLVPARPDPREFPKVTHACLEQNRCAICTVHCLFGRGHLQQKRVRVPTSTRFQGER